MSGHIVDIAVVGGGHTGLLSAIALKTVGFNVVVIERSFETDLQSGRTLALLSGSQRWMADIGVWSAVASDAEAVRYVDVGDPSTSVDVRYSHEDVAAGDLAWGIRQAELRRALLEHFVSVLGGEIVAGEISTATRADGQVELSTTDGSGVSARLLVGADGRGSRIRQLARIGIERTDFAQQALSFVVAHKRDHRQTVMERFLAGGPLASLPLRNKHSGITWVRKSTKAIENPKAMLVSLADVLGRRLGGLRLASRIDANPLGALHAHNYVAPRIALVGDAAHGTHPIHAQGFNMAVADVEALTRVLVTARERGDDIGGASLRRYEALRRADNRSRLAMTTNLNRLFGHDSAIVRPVRAAVLGGLRHIPPLRRKAIRHGMRLPG